MHIEAYNPYPTGSMNMAVSSGVDVVDGVAYANPYRPTWRCPPPPGHSFRPLEDPLLVRAEIANEMKTAGIHPFLRHETPPSIYSIDMSGTPHSASSASGIHPGVHQVSQHLYSMPEHHHTNTPTGDTGNGGGGTPGSFNSAAAAAAAAAAVQQHQQQMQHQINVSCADQQSHVHSMNSAVAAAVNQQRVAASYPVAYNASYSAAAAAAAAVVNSNHAAAAAGMAASHGHHTMSPHSLSPHYALPPHHAHELDYDPRELEAFAERFKQRRIKLGVTQADVGKALGNLKLTGVGSLSQSTICRFESLTLSHNNMVALKPVLQAWLEEAELQAAEQLKNPDIYGESADKKRKRTSITDAEKRSLEAYFAVQPRPSSEKIAQIAEKLNLKKNVVRVWFCNQRQKQKRMKFSTVGLAHHGQGL